MAWVAYCEQLGKNRQLRPRRALKSRWYRTIRRTARAWRGLCPRELVCLASAMRSVKAAGCRHPFDEAGVGCFAYLTFGDKHIVVTGWHFGVADRRPKAASDSISLHCVSYSFPRHQPDVDLVGLAGTAHDQKAARSSAPAGIENPAKIGPFLDRPGPYCLGPPQAVSRLRPLALRALRIARPARSDIR